MTARIARSLWCAVLVGVSLAAAAAGSAAPGPAYFDNQGRVDVLAGGVRMIPIQTPKGTFRVWTKRVGNNPKLKVLLLHGGPGFTHEYFEAVDSYFPGAGVEYYYSDQLGSAYSDQPDEPSLWDLPRFVDEVDQVRKALGLGPDNFVLMGTSWGGMLAIEYALAHPDALKGLVIGHMVSSIPYYNKYAHDVLMPAMDQKVLRQILDLEAKQGYDDPRYEELLMGFYTEHILRMPPEAWPEPVLRSLSHLNKKVYIPMQGPSEMGAGGKLVDWDRSADLGRIKVPTLVIGARYDTMDPAHMEWMAKQMPRGRYLFCPNGSHLALYDDQKVFFDGLLSFLADLEAGKL
jgi:proline iminopeptidase